MSLDTKQYVYNPSKLTDFTVIHNKDDIQTEFKLHKYKLATTCDYFNKLFDDDSKSIQIKLPITFSWSVDQLRSFFDVIYNCHDDAIQQYINKPAVFGIHRLAHKDTLFTTNNQQSIDMRTTMHIAQYFNAQNTIITLEKVLCNYSRDSHIMLSFELLQLTELYKLYNLEKQCIISIMKDESKDEFDSVDDILITQLSLMTLKKVMSRKSIIKL